MNITAMKHERKRKIEEQQANMKARRKSEIEDVITKAIKRYGPNGTKRRGGVALMETSPEAQIAALDQYVTDLRTIGAELELRYPDVSRRRFWMIDHEIDTAVEAVARLEIERVTPGK